jgi:hypothetical protein
VLGFQVGRGNGRMTLNLPKLGWRELERTLMQTHQEAQAGQLAREVVNGWMEATAPAFESMEAKNVIQRVVATATQAGFRELGPTTALEDRLRSGIDRWSSVRRKVARERWQS